MFSRYLNFFAWVISFCVFSSVLLAGVVVYFVIYYNKDLPDYNDLKNYEPAIVTRIYAANGMLLGEYAIENRVYVPIKAIPKKVINAFLAAEDKNFYEHPGIDFQSLIRAGFQNVINFSTNKNLVGGSTITQQVVKNFLLTNERTLSRKIREAILSFRITQAFTKDRILELYLNDIYLGNGSYGVASAALNYFNKSLDELNYEEAALLASLPKAPSQFDPHKNYKRAEERRNYVLERMYDDSLITLTEFKNAVKTPIVLRKRDFIQIAKADYFLEEVRREIMEKYGSKMLYEGGLTVHTTLDPEIQKIAERAFYEGILSYDKRHGYKKPLKTLDNITNWQTDLQKIQLPLDAHDSWNLAVVLQTHNEKAEIGLVDGSKAEIPLSEIKWARYNVKKTSDVLKIGDVILVEPIENNEKTVFALRQVPAVNGGFVVEDPENGRVLALVGGFSQRSSEFNRATQAKRQPGSTFKPWVYMAALENGYTPATEVLDAPVSIYQGPGLPMWTPKNYENKYLGVLSLRTALEKSRNTVTVRLAESVGVGKILDLANIFGLAQNAPKVYSTVLGTSETTLLNLTNAYGMIANGGNRISPSLIEKIQDRNGNTIYKRDMRECGGCILAENPDIYLPPEIEDKRERIIDERTAYQMTSILEGVTKRGTAARAASLKKTVAGKTGTTNDSKDLWFMGYTPELVVGTYIGYDTPKSLGNRETGASGALPIFISFMQEQLKDKPDIPFKIPAGIKLVRMDNGQYEAFKLGTEPSLEPTEESGDMLGLDFNKNDEDLDGVY